MKLSIELSKWRCDRPDEWKMDEFIRNAEKLQAERDALAAQVSELKKEKLYLGSCLDNAADRIEMNIREKQAAFDKCNNLESQLANLSAHDAEVAKAAFIAGACGFDKDSDLYMGAIEYSAERYAASLKK